MSFTKKNYIDGETVITAGDLNGIQDELIRVAGIADAQPDTPAENGGYYTPTVTQPTSDTMRISFSGSKSDMPAVSPAAVTLPKGQQGDAYVLTETDKSDIADIAAQQLAGTTYSKPEIDSKLDGYATKEYVDNAVGGINIPVVPTKISAFENDKGYLTAHQDLSDYAKKQDIPDVSGFVTAADVEAMGYQTEEQVNTLIAMAISAISRAEDGAY